jgi:hypothetical protein
MSTPVRTRFFGDFLIEGGFAAREHVVAAARRMREVNRTLAAMAQERGWLTAAQVEQIHSEQLVAGRIWGEQAVALGLLDQAQVMRLLADQRARHIRLGEALLEQGGITRADLERALASFAEERAQLAARPRRLPAPLESCAAARFALDHFAEHCLRIARLPARLGDAAEWKGDTEHEYRARIALTGASGVVLGIAAGRDFGAVLAEGWLDLAESELDHATLVDLTGELLRLLAERAAAVASGAEPLSVGALETDELPGAGTAVEFAAPYGRGLLILDPR